MWSSTNSQQCLHGLGKFFPGLVIFELRWNLSEEHSNDKLKGVPPFYKELICTRSKLIKILKAWTYYRYKPLHHVVAWTILLSIRKFATTIWNGLTKIRWICNIPSGSTHHHMIMVAPEWDANHCFCDAYKLDSKVCWARFNQSITILDTFLIFLQVINLFSPLKRAHISFQERKKFLIGTRDINSISGTWRLLNSAGSHINLWWKLLNSLLIYLK